MLCKKLRGAFCPWLPAFIPFRFPPQSWCQKQDGQTRCQEATDHAGRRYSGVNIPKETEVEIGWELLKGQVLETCKKTSTTQCENDTMSYWMNLSSAWSPIHKQVKGALPNPAAGSLHELKPGVVKDPHRRSWHRRWRKGRFQVLLTTHKGSCS